MSRNPLVELLRLVQKPDISGVGRVLSVGSGTARVSVNGSEIEALVPQALSILVDDNVLVDRGQITRAVSGKRHEVWID